MADKAKQATEKLVRCRDGQKITIALRCEIYECLRAEIHERRSSVVDFIAELIEARLNGVRAPVPRAVVTTAAKAFTMYRSQQAREDGAPAQGIRVSAYLSDVVIRQLKKRAGKISVPKLLGDWIDQHFRRVKKAA